MSARGFDHIAWRQASFDYMQRGVAAQRRDADHPDDPDRHGDPRSCRIAAEHDSILLSQQRDRLFRGRDRPMRGSPGPQRETTTAWETSMNPRVLRALASACARGAPAV